MILVGGILMTFYIDKDWNVSGKTEANGAEDQLRKAFSQHSPTVQDETSDTYAMRFNEGKPQLSLLPLDFLSECAKVLEFGAEKYARNNFRKGMPISKILDSLLRHVSAIQRGELVDPESNLPHIAHIQCNALFLGNSKNTNDL
jgi:hypothetical protein